MVIKWAERKSVSIIFFFPMILHVKMKIIETLFLSAYFSYVSFDKYDKIFDFYTSSFLKDTMVPRLNHSQSKSSGNHKSFRRQFCKGDTYFNRMKNESCPNTSIRINDIF